MRRRREKEDLFDKAADILDIPSEVIAGMPRITATGTSRVLIESHRGILEYGDEEIIVNGGKIIVKIKGAGLSVGCMTRCDILICGDIKSVEFER